MVLAPQLIPLSPDDVVRRGETYGIRISAAYAPGADRVAMGSAFARAWLELQRHVRPFSFFGTGIGASTRPPDWLRPDLIFAAILGETWRGEGETEYTVAELSHAVAARYAPLSGIRLEVFRMYGAQADVLQFLDLFDFADTSGGASVASGVRRVGNAAGATLEGVTGVVEGAGTAARGVGDLAAGVGTGLQGIGAVARESPTFAIVVAAVVAAAALAIVLRAK